jgi:predicted Zn-dependent peptidase
MLGESSSSRLFLELREERGLCYQIGSDVNLFDETGTIEITAGLDPDARREALACIHREIGDLCNHGPQAGELDRAKCLAITQSKLAFESSAAHASWAGEGLMDFGRIPAIDEWRARILAVDDRQVMEIARQVFHQKPHAMAEIHSGPA